ncbi:MAG: hypothetical protein ACJAWY_000261 [Sphingomonas echinoides]|jgi:hypothetical protein
MAGDDGLPVFRNRTELSDRVLSAFAFLGVDKAMVDMVVDECPLGARDSVLDRLKLLRDVDAGALLLDHPDDTAQMAGGPIQAFDDSRVTGVSIVSHAPM